MAAPPTAASDTDQSPNTFTLNIAATNAAPVVDLDADDSNTVGTGFAAPIPRAAPRRRSPTPTCSITDADAGDDIVSATITITNAVAGDVLTVVGALPGSDHRRSGPAPPPIILLTGTGTAAEYEAAIEQITFSNSGDNPTALGTNTSRTINVTVNDGDCRTTSRRSPPSPSPTTMPTRRPAPARRSPRSRTRSGCSSAADLGFSDVDGTFASVTISARQRRRHLFRRRRHRRRRRAGARDPARDLHARRI